MNAKYVKKGSCILAVLVSIMLVSAMSYAAGQFSENYTIESDVISAGGGQSSCIPSVDNYCVEHTTGQSVVGYSESTGYKNYAGFWHTVPETCIAPAIDNIDTGTCHSEHANADLSAAVTDSCGGNLTYVWTPLNGGTIIGSGANVEFDPPPAGPNPCPYQVEVQITSDASGLDVTQVIDVYMKNAGDANGDGIVNVVDKFFVRSKNGLSEGNTGWDYDADVTCDGTVNVFDKVIVRQRNGETGGCEPPPSI